MRIGTEIDLYEEVKDACERGELSEYIAEIIFHKNWSEFDVTTSSIFYIKVFKGSDKRFILMVDRDTPYIEVSDFGLVNGKSSLEYYKDRGALLDLCQKISKLISSDYIVEL